MRAATILSLGLLVASAGCIGYVRPGDGYQEQRYVDREAVFPNGQRLLVREDRADADLVVVQPRELAGQRVVVDPDQPQNGQVLVVRPVRDRRSARGY